MEMIMMMISAMAILSGILFLIFAMILSLARLHSTTQESSSKKTQDLRKDWSNLSGGLNASIERVNKAHLAQLQAKISVLQVDNDILRLEMLYMELNDGNHSPNFAMPLENEKPVFENYPEIVTYGVTDK